MNKSKLNMNVMQGWVTNNQSSTCKARGLARVANSSTMGGCGGCSTHANTPSMSDACSLSHWLTLAFIGQAAGLMWGPHTATG